MYRELQTNPITNNNDIWCVPYKNLRLNENTNAKCIDIFPNGIPDDAAVVYSSSEEGIIVLGYYILDGTNMTLSTNYESLKNATIALQKTDPTEQIKQQNCVHIREWIFDNSLRNKEYLRKICNIIVSTDWYTSSFIVWFNNSRGEISFYHINNDDFISASAVFYFINEFMNE